jgi:nucleotide-binding universal stress UspA family protein
MSYRTLLVPLDADRHLPARLRVTADVAVRHDAHVIGLHLGADIAAQADEFGRAMQAAGVPSFELRGEAEADMQAAQADADAMLARHAAWADLLVVSVPSAPGTARLARWLSLGGRPLLALPDRPEVSGRGSRVVVAWNGSREANRALADALPWLRKAAEVSVVCFDHPDEAAFTRLELNDMQRWLERHDVDAQVLQRSCDGTPEEALMQMLKRRSCDLLVMGAFGRSPWVERALGGFTHEMLGALSLPMLLSH